MEIGTIFPMNEPLNIAVIGCGTAGLACAIGLASDHSVQLFEKFEHAKPVGAGIMLQYTGLKALAYFGLEQDILKKGAVINYLSGHDFNGSTVFNVHYSDLKQHLFGLGIHRGTLFETLYHKVQKQKILIKSNTAILSTLQKSGQRFLVDQNNIQYGPFDLVIDASGANSILRQHYSTMLYNHKYPYGALWTVFEDPNKEYATNALYQVYDSAHKMLGLLPVGQRPGDQLNCTTFFWSLPLADYVQWQDVGLDAWKKEVIKYCPHIESALEQIQSQDQLALAKYSHSMMKQWNYDQLVFIGDAGHSMSPQLGQGGNLALVDAAVLVQMLRQNKDVNKALSAYNTKRKKHLMFYQHASRFMTPFFQSQSRLAGSLRNLCFDAMYQVPYFRKEMIGTLIGSKTGLLSSIDFETLLYK